MTEQIKIEYGKFIANFPILSFIGSREVTYKELKEKIEAEISGLPDERLPKEFREHRDVARYMQALSPIVVITSSAKYKIDMVVLRTILGSFYSCFMDGIFSKEAIADLIREKFPEYMMVEIKEVESDEHQSYKYLYELMADDSEQTIAELASAKENETSYQTQIETLLKSEKTYEEEKGKLLTRISDLEEQKRQLMNTLQQLQTGDHTVGMKITEVASAIESLTSQPIYINGFCVRDIEGMEIAVASDSKIVNPETLSGLPAIYNFKRPSWFTALSRGLTKKEVSKKNVLKTAAVLSEKVAFWKKIEEQKSVIEKLAIEVDENRRKNIVTLLNSKLTNEEKFLKYMLLTPGLPKDYLKTLNGAADLGLSANIIIELLEQPKESFNKEIVEAFVSEAHKGTEYNLKKELAEELIRGEWYITADINGVEEKMQLVPFRQLQEMINSLMEKCGVVEGSNE